MVWTRHLRIRNQWVREFLAEFLGTFILMVFGDGNVAQSVLSSSAAGEFLSINVGWWVAVTMGVYASAGVSGGHINPAVSLALAVVGKFSWIKLPMYVLAQFLGSFAASACLYGVYLDALNAYDGGNRTVIGPKGTAGIWATYPQDFLSLQGGLGDQIFATGLLLVCVLAITDKRNDGAPSGMAAIMVGLSVLGIGVSFGFNCGYAINPARDFPPRLFTYCAGWGVDVWVPNGMHWWWVPIVGPCIGAVLGALLYILCVEAHHTPEDELPITEGDAYAVSEDVVMKRREEDDSL
ncbi:aquaporin-7-like [Acanthaster planci]|uniref:Aquaporin-7-like n=1 Tax=Acanthaster planci TaxID=133434 RepID=A0A8B7YQ61_ACAPL|nr:aquaporin-7-like [Acanthaster planci]